MKAVKEVKSTNYYAWLGTRLQVYIYTTNENPQIGDTLYNYDGNNFEASVAEIVNVSNNIITTDTFVPGVGVMSYERDNSADTFVTETNFKAIKVNADYKLISEPHTELIPAVNILGGLTNTNNVLSNFTVNNYAQLPQDLQFNTEGNQWDDRWEIVFKIKLNNEATTGTDSAIISTSLSRSYNPRLVVWNNLQVALLLTNSTNSWNVCEINSDDTYLTIGDWYWIKVTCLGWTSSKSDYNLYISTNGTDYSRVGGKLNTNSYKATALKNIGFCHDNSNGDLNFKGEIDLTESYIKVNGNIWWEGTKELNIQ